jgi:hypothetical protein
MELVEAAVRTGRDHEARAHVAAAHEARLSEISPRLALVTAGSTAMCATDETARASFDTALAVPGAEQALRPARIELVRRTPPPPESGHGSTPASTALDTFQRLQAHPWTARVAGELRATVSRSARRTCSSSVADAATTRDRPARRRRVDEQRDRRATVPLPPHRRHAPLPDLPEAGIASRAALRDASKTCPRSSSRGAALAPFDRDYVTRPVI